MKKFILTPIFVLIVQILAFSQTVGSTKTEQYKASFETAIDISQFMDYEGKQIPIQILKAGISDEMYEMYPELKEKRVGLGVANISMEYLENLNRFKFTEDRTEIKIGWFYNSKHPKPEFLKTNWMVSVKSIWRNIS